MATWSPMWTDRVIAGGQTQTDRHTHTDRVIAIPGQSAPGHQVITLSFQFRYEKESYTEQSSS